MFEILFDAWEYILGVSAVMGLITCILQIMKKIKKILFPRSAAILLDVILVASCIFLALSCFVATSFTRVPNLIGSTVYEAENLLLQENLTLSLPADTQNDSKPNDRTIINQELVAGSLVWEKTAVTVELSSGESIADMVVVESVIGMEETLAVEKLEDMGLDVQVYWHTGVDDTQDQYYIAEQSIPAGSYVPPHTLIELRRVPVQPGTLVPIPNVIGMEQTEAILLLENSGFDYQVWWIAEDNIAAEQYYIIHQSLPEGTVAPAGTLIELQLSVTKP